MIRYTLINVLQKKKIYIYIYIYLFIYIFGRFLLTELETDKDGKEKKNTQS